MSQFPPRYNNSLFYEEHMVKHFLCRMPPDVPFEKLLEPASWCHEGDRLKPGDIIDVLCDDFSYEASLRVIESGHLYAKVALRFKRALEAKSDDAATLEVEFIANKFRVKRGQDVLKADFSTKRDAERWIRDYAGKAA